MFMGNHVFAEKLTFDLVSVSISSLYPIRKYTFLNVILISKSILDLWPKSILWVKLDIYKD